MMKRNRKSWKLLRCSALVVFYFLLSTLALGAPTPTPYTVITATGTVRFTWTAPPIKTASGTAIPAATSYDFVEKIGATYKLLRNTTNLYFDVANIGNNPRVFGVVARSANGPGVIREVAFPGMAGAVKGYLQIGQHKG